MTTSIRLGDFILTNMEPILEQWEIFAKTIDPPSLTMDSPELRDHAKLMLQTIALDLAKGQTSKAQAEKSKGEAPDNPNVTPAEDHAEQRLISGYTIGQLFSEYRALRASVLRLWEKSAHVGLTTDAVDITRFNEAIDQAVAESVERYSKLLKTSQDMFLAILGHDLRNPLSTTMVSAQMLLMYDDVNDKVKADATRIYNTSQRMNRLITDLLDYSSNQLGQGLSVILAPTNIAKICNDIVEEQQIAHPFRSIVVETNGTFEGNWDEQRIAQVFSNLLGNAIQHGITESPIQVNLVSTQDSVIIKINNQGTPIPKLKIKSIFDPLTRHKETENGDYSQNSSLGLGLYISKEIVLGHNGVLSVTSTKKEGTTFTISLPIEA